MYDGLQIHKINSKISVKIFSTQNFRNPSIFAIFDQKLNKPSEPAELSRHKDAYNRAKWPQYNPYEMGKKVSKFLLPHQSKITFLCPKMARIDRKFENFSKKFLVRIDLDWSKT